MAINPLTEKIGEQALVVVFRRSLRELFDALSIEDKKEFDRASLENNGNGFDAWFIKHKVKFAQIVQSQCTKLKTSLTN